MALITLADVENALVDFSFTETTTPSEAQVTWAIALAEGDVRAWLVSNGGVWPSDAASDVAAMLKLTVLSGVRVQVYDQIYGVVGDAGIPEGKRAAEREFADRMKRVAEMARATRQGSADVAAPALPLVGSPYGQQTLAGDYADYVARRDRHDSWLAAQNWPGSWRQR